MILMIDNYDSFTYNIVDLLRQAGEEVNVSRNNEITLEGIRAIAPDFLMISPGPGRPEDAGISLAAVREFAGKIPIFGVCLGHQVIVEGFGGKIVQSPTIMHGKRDTVSHDSHGVYRNIPQNLEVVRYHSLAADPGSLPEVLDVTSRAGTDGAIMGVRHRDFQVEGVQFHPESIGTDFGMKIIQNFLHYKRGEAPITKIFQHITEGVDLSAEDAYEIMDEITNGELSDGQIGAFLGALAVKGVTPTELSAFAKVLLGKTGVSQERGAGFLDTCGTGGDGRHTFNISSAAALVSAAAGVKVAKHGNKAVSSKSGSFDFYQALGLPVRQPYEACLKSIEENNFAFLFAPLFHRAMKYVGRVRQELKVRTVFNMIGPLVNPLRPEYQVTGVFSEQIMDLYAQTMSKLGLKRGMVVHSLDHLDEISICEPTLVREISSGEIQEYQIDPADFGISGFRIEDLEGGNASENAGLFLEVIAGKRETRKQEAVAKAVALNAAAGLYLTGTAETLLEGYNKAHDLLKSGAVEQRLALLCT